MRVGSRGIGESIYTGAVQGIVAWTAYGVVECWFSSILPWMIKPRYDYVPLHWGFTALLFGLYPAIGLILGGSLGLALHLASGRIPSLRKAQPVTRFQAAAALTVVLAFAVNFVFQFGISSSGLPVMSMSLLLILALSLSAVSHVRSSRFGFLTNPWAICMVLIGLAWINKDLLAAHSRGVKALADLAYSLAIFSIGFLAHKVMERRRTSGSAAGTSPSPTRVFLVPVVLVVFSTSSFLDRSPRVAEWKQKASSPGADQPNVLLIVMDTVRADHTSLYGYERDTTPNLKKLSEEATLYSNAIAAGDMTLTSHASLFTGMYAIQHGAHYDPPYSREGRPLADEFNTLAEILSENGYLTIGVVANYVYLRHAFGLDQGFQYYDERMPVFFLGRTRPYYLRRGIRNFLTRFASPFDYDRLWSSAEEINRKVFALLDKAKRDGHRFFLFVNYMDAHDPYYPPPPFDQLYPGKDESFTSAHYYALKRAVAKLERRITERERRHLLSQYDGGIAYLDFHIGRLITRLKELGLYENCLIVITSDHGEAFGERGIVGHGASVYQDQVRVPLVIKYPNVRRKAVVDEVVSTVDIMPTILGVLEYEAPENLRGKNLLKLEPGNSRIVISASFQNDYLISLHSRFNRVERALFLRPFKLISSTSGKRELYDLSKDPNERENLYQSNGMARELEARLDQWLKTIKAERVRGKLGSSPQLDEKTIERLRSLGYIR